MKGGQQENDGEMKKSDRDEHPTYCDRYSRQRRSDEFVSLGAWIKDGTQGTTVDFKLAKA